MHLRTLPRSGTPWPVPPLSVLAPEQQNPMHQNRAAGPSHAEQPDLVEQRNETPMGLLRRRVTTAPPGSPRSVRQILAVSDSETRMQQPGHSKHGLPAGVIPSGEASLPRAGNETKTRQATRRDRKSSTKPIPVQATLSHRKRNETRVRLPSATPVGATALAAGNCARTPCTRTIPPYAPPTLSPPQGNETPARLAGGRQCHFNLAATHRRAAAPSPAGAASGPPTAPAHGAFSYRQAGIVSRPTLQGTGGAALGAQQPASIVPPRRRIRRQRAEADGSKQPNVAQ